MANNVSTVISDNYNYDGYVEFFNDGAEVDIKGWNVVNEKEENTNWSVVLDSSHIIPYGYSLLFFGKKETGSQSAGRVVEGSIGCVGNKLCTDVGSISFEKDGRKITIDYPAQVPHLSYCNSGFMEPSPGKENNKLITTIDNRVAKPYFKTGEPGLCDGELKVELGCNTDGSDIYYTLNGDTPSQENGTLYASPIEVNQNTVIRARAYKTGMLYSEIATGSYILPDVYYEECKSLGERLPVVSLAINNDDVYDDTIGFYVEGKNGIASTCTPESNYNQDWMRSANFEYILDGKVVDSQEVEVGVYGGCTRIHVAKSLKIKANKRSGRNKMTYTAFFPDRTYKKYKSLALRNGGNGYSYVQPRWRDMFIQSLGVGMNLDLQAAQPVSFYLNGKFYGMMILTERTDEDYVYHNYGLDEDEIDMLHVSTGYVCDNGTIKAYNKMIDYVSNNYDDDDFYEKLENYMDIDNYIDYQILEQYVGNTDWVTNNTKLWRKHDGGKFRWITFDTDFGLSKASKVDTCMLDFATTLMKNGSMERSIVLMKSCMKNEDFRWRFLDQYIDRLENQFTDEKIDSNLDSIESLTARDMYVTLKNAAFLGCPGNSETYNEEIENMRTFAKLRKKYVVEQLKKEFALGNDTSIIKVRTVFPNEENPNFSFLINKRKYSGANYNTWRFFNERMKVEPIVPAGYRIAKWTVNNSVVLNNDGSRYTGESLVSTADSSEMRFIIYFEHDPDYSLPSNLHLNEVCASNKSTPDENGETSDWIEVYNGNDADIDMAGMTIENVTKAVKCTIPSSNGETVVPAHGYKLLWADKNPEVGPLHLNFKLGASAAENIILWTTCYGKDVELSNLTYTPLESDESYGRESDGAQEMRVFAKCVDDNGNEFMTSTPASANGSVVCNTSFVENLLAESHNKQVYSEGKNIHVQNAQNCAIRVYNMLGDVMINKKSDSNLFVLTIPTPGIYLVKIDNKCWKVELK